MLEFDSVTKSYGGTVVLDDLSFDVRPGQMFGFCGANGAGKTTTMRIALGLVRADRGQVRWNGRPIDLEMRRRIGYMPEERGLYPKMRVLDQLTYFGMLHGMTKTAAHDSALPLIDRLAMPVRSAAGAVAWWELVLAVVLNLVAIALVIRLGGRVYAGALLRTGGKVKIKDALAGS